MSSLKCELSDCGKFLEPCDALGRLVEYGNPTGSKKGIYMWQYYDRVAGAKHAK